MTQMLASINSLEEARIIMDSASAVGIIDLKNPQQGALGALTHKEVIDIVNFINQAKPVSATIGDLPMQADILHNAVTTMAATGVDYIKIGFFPNGDWQSCLNALTPLTQTKPSTALIAVLFADTQPDLSIIKAIAKAGFSGVMLDTADKQKGALPQLLTTQQIQHFVSTAKQHQLICGLAGSLRKQDIAKLIQLDADYLGFRSALCQAANRTEKINFKRISSIIRILYSST